MTLHEVPEVLDMDPLASGWIAQVGFHDYEKWLITIEVALFASDHNSADFELSVLYAARGSADANHGELSNWQVAFGDEELRLLEGEDKIPLDALHILHEAVAHAEGYLTGWIEAEFEREHEDGMESGVTLTVPGGPHMPAAFISRGKSLD